MRKQNFFEFISNSSVSTSFLFIWGETINTFIHSRSSLENHTRFQTKKDQKPCPLGRTYLYIGSISPGDPSTFFKYQLSKVLPVDVPPQDPTPHPFTHHFEQNRCITFCTPSTEKYYSPTYLLLTLIFMLGYMK